MKLVSIDIETTGLDPDIHQIIEFAAVIWDTDNKADFSRYLHFIVPHRHDNYLVDPYCAILHKDLWPKLVRKKDGGFDHTWHYADMIPSVIKPWLKMHGIEKLIPAGKNFSGFDLPFLKANGDWSEIRMGHRAFDPGILYYRPGDADIPNLTTCLNRAGLEPTGLHTALGDAIDVCRLLGAKL